MFFERRYQNFRRKLEIFRRDVALDAVGVFRQVGASVDQFFVEAILQAAETEQLLFYDVPAIIEGKDDEVLLQEFFIFREVGRLHFEGAGGEEAVALYFPRGFQAVQVAVYKLIPKQAAKRADGAGEGCGLDVPAHGFRGTQSLYEFGDLVLQKIGGGVSAFFYAGEKIFLAVLLDASDALDGKTHLAGEAKRGLGRFAVFEGNGNGRAFHVAFFYGLFFSHGFAEEGEPSGRPGADDFFVFQHGGSQEGFKSLFHLGSVAGKVGSGELFSPDL